MAVVTQKYYDRRFPEDIDFLSTEIKIILANEPDFYYDDINDYCIENRLIPEIVYAGIDEYLKTKSPRKYVGDLEPAIYVGPYGEKAEVKQIPLIDPERFEFDYLFGDPPKKKSVGAANQLVPSYPDQVTPDEWKLFLALFIGIPALTFLFYLMTRGLMS